MFIGGFAWCLGIDWRGPFWLCVNDFDQDDFRSGHCMYVSIEGSAR